MMKFMNAWTDIEKINKSIVFPYEKNGMFINITSMFGLIGYPTCTIYSATKFALDGFSECLASSLPIWD
ncbi:SDR family NAD(P)-dependent oxidoreductase [Aquirufa beregesia]